MFLGLTDVIPEDNKYVIVKIMEKFQNKYRIQSNRMPCWDYSGKGAYFITICVNNRDCILGHVEQDEMILNDFGKIAQHEWKISAQIRNEIELDAFVIMPNKPKLYRKPKSISSFIAGYKSSVTTKINNLIDKHLNTHGRAYQQNGHAYQQNGRAFQLVIQKFNRKNRLWQVNYNDHII